MSPRYFRALSILVLSFLVASSRAEAEAPTFVEDFLTTDYQDVVTTTAYWDTGAGELRLFPFSPSVIGTADTPGLAHGVAVHGDLAFVGDGQYGLQIIDIGDPTNPVVIGSYDTPGAARSVAVSGDLAFVTDLGAGLQIIDIGDPTNPLLIGNFDTAGNAGGVVVDGSLAFVADEAPGVHVLDISNPAAPTLVSTYNTSGLAIGVAVDGDFLFVADWDAGLQILDISDPSAPALVGTMLLPGPARSVAVDGNTAFIADDIYGLQIVDISNPATPVLVGASVSGANALGVTVSGDLVYVAEYDGGLRILDVSDLTNPTSLFTVNTPGKAISVTVEGDVAYLANYEYGLQAIRVGHVVNSPALVGSFAASKALGVTVAGDLAFVADYSDGFTILDISNPSSPTVVSTYAMPVPITKVAVAGDLAFVAEYAGDLQVLDISSPESPTLVGTYLALGDAQDVEVAGDLAFLAGSSSGLEIIDISDPTNPVRVGRYTPWGLMDVALAGDLAIVAIRHSGLHFIDISDPASLVLVGSLSLPDVVGYITVAGNLAFVSEPNSGAVQIVDYGDPSAPTVVGSYSPLGGTAWEIEVVGNLALVGVASPPLLELVDITNPASPVLIGTYDLLERAEKIAVAGNLALVANRADGLEILQVFQNEFDQDNRFGQSLAFAGGVDPILRARVSAAQTVGVGVELSASGGSSWQLCVPDATWTALSVSGSSLTWRSTHEWRNPGVNPTLSNLQIDWLYDSAVIDAITDIPNDQGRQVRIEWTRSGHDFVGDASQIVEYAIYREIDASLGAQAQRDEPAELIELSPAAQENAQMMLAAGWDFVMTVPVLVEDCYAAVVPTLADSTVVSGLVQSTFRVTALTATPGVFFHSRPDSGYSVDNVAPGVPAGLLLIGNELSWEESTAPDFQHFTVYGSPSQELSTGSTPIAYTVEPTQVIDPGAYPYLHVTATDAAGNEGAAALLDLVTAVDPGTPSARSFRLGAAMPNPFNPSTRISYSVPVSGRVSLTVFDAAGRTVRILIDEAVDPGDHFAEWNGTDRSGAPVGSGVYFYRLDAVGSASTRKMVLLK